MPNRWSKLSLGLCLSTAIAWTAAAAETSSSQYGSATSSAQGSARSDTSRSISLNENGKQISITEDSSGITVTTTETVAGEEKRTEVKAANARDLKAKSPEAYRLYAQHLGGAKNSASARAGSGSANKTARGFGNSTHLSGGASSSGGSFSSGGASSSGGGTSRSVSFTENGKTVTITESSDSGITVTVTETVGGKEKKTVAKAANAQQLARKNPAAFRLYKSHIDGAQGQAGANGNGGPADARELLREQLRKQIQDNAGNPPMKAMLEKMLNELEK